MLYPDVYTELNFTTPLELLVATVLSAQTTDVRVNLVTPTLFARYPTAADYAGADREELEKIIQSTGFYHAKANSLLGLGQALCERYGGEVPGRLKDLVTLPGVQPQVLAALDEQQVGTVRPVTEQDEHRGLPAAGGGRGELRVHLHRGGHAR